MPSNRMPPPKESGEPAAQATALIEDIDGGIKSFIIRYWSYPALLFLLFLWFTPIISLGSEWWLSHCSWYVPMRAVGVLDAWRHDIWDARWIPGFDYGYGSPIHTFYAPAFSWMSAFFLSFISNTSLALRLHLFLWLLFGTCGMYLASERFWRYVYAGAPSWLPLGLIAAAAWLLSPQLLCDAYVRGDLPELAAVQTFPWIFWAQMELLASTESWRTKDSIRLLLLMLFISLGVLLHNFMGLVCVSIALLMIPLMLWIRYFDPTGAPHPLARFTVRTISSLGGIAGALTLTLFFWLPAMKETGFTSIADMKGGFYEYTGHFVYIENLIQIRYWGFGSSLNGPGDEMPLHLGWMGCLGLLSAVAGFYIAFTCYNRQKDRVIAGILALLFCAGIALFLTLRSSTPIWRMVTILQWAQFPWRLLVVPAFCLSMLAPALIVAVESARPRRIIVSLLLAFLAASVALSYHDYVRVSGSIAPPGELDPKTWQRNRITTTDIDEYRPKWVPPDRRPEYSAGSVIAEPPVRLVQFRSKGARVIATLENESSELHSVMVAFNYFPGWKAKVISTGEELEAIPDERTGFLRIEGLTAGKSRIKVWFGNTSTQKTAKIISGVGWAGWLASLCFLLFRSAIRGRRAKRKPQPQPQPMRPPRSG